MNYSFHKEAESEFFEAIDYYESCQRGLGYDFAVEVYSTMTNIVEYPKAWPTMEDDVRRCQTKRFPYGIVYSVEGGKIFILAVMHLYREPNYWKDRLK